MGAHAIAVRFSHHFHSVLLRKDRQPLDPETTAALRFSELLVLLRGSNEDTFFLQKTLHSLDGVFCSNVVVGTTSRNKSRQTASFSRQIASWSLTNYKNFHKRH